MQKPAGDWVLEGLSVSRPPTVPEQGTRESQDRQQLPPPGDHRLLPPSHSASRGHGDPELPQSSEQTPLHVTLLGNGGQRSEEQALRP